MKNHSQRQWTQGSGDNGEGWDDERERMPRIELPKVKKFWFVLGGLFILFAVVLPWFATFMTDLYWFEAQGFESVFWRRFWARWELFAAALAPGFVIYALNWQLAWKRGVRLMEEAGADALAGRRVRLFILGAALLVAAVNALNAMGMWHEFLKFMNPTPFGTTDPLFGIDIGFYIFSLPFLKFLQLWMQGVLMLALIGSAALYFMTRSVSFTPGRLYVAPQARLHLTLLGALILILWGIGYWIARYELLFSPTGAAGPLHPRLRDVRRRGAALREFFQADVEVLRDRHRTAHSRRLGGARRRSRACPAIPRKAERIRDGKGVSRLSS